MEGRRKMAEGETEREGGREGGREEGREECMIAERLSARLLIVQCGQLAFVCIYIGHIYIYM